MEIRRDAAGLVRSALPGYLADRARRYERAFRRQQALPDLAERLTGDRTLEVRYGPFAGLKYPRARVDDVDAPVAKLLGTYEQEITPYLEAALSGSPAFVDIGCADGFYAVGAAVFRCDLTVFAYDISKSARRMCAEVATLNGCLDRIHLRRRFRASSMSEVPSGSVVLCDIEGGEFSLFSADLIDRLRDSDVIVEVHASSNDEGSKALAGRFAKTHDVELVHQVGRRPDAVAELTSWTASEALTALNEFRDSAQHWLCCTFRR